MGSPIPHEWLAFDEEEAIDLATGFLADEVSRAGAEGVVVGLSGGVDSATALHVARRVLDPGEVDAVFLPGPTSPDQDEKRALEVARSAGVDLSRVPIGPGVEALEPEMGVDVDRDTRANLQARLRMCVLYARANAGGGLVLGTGNKSELLTGYFTKYGDGGVDLLPLGDVYKTQLRALARRLGVPEAAVEREPTAGLWEGQTDEGELGLTYPTLDVVLAGIEREVPDAEVAAEAGVDEAEVERVRGLVDASRHKRAGPPVAEIGERTPGVDWRQPTT